MIDWFLLDVDWNRYMDRLPNNDLLVNGNLDRDRVRSGDMDCLVYWVWVGFGHLNWVWDGIRLGNWNRFEDRDWMMFDDRDWDSYWFRDWNWYWFGNRYWFRYRNDLLHSLVHGNLDRNVNGMRD